MGFDKKAIAESMSSAQKAIAIIPAAGSSSRMGLSQSKLLCQVNGISVLQRTLTAVSDTELFESILVPCRDSDIEAFSKCAKNLGTPVEFFTGGTHRQESVLIALKRIQQMDCSKSDLIVMIHDAARCFVSRQLIEQAVDEARNHKAVSAAIACVDTVYKIDDNNQLVLPLLERSQLRSIQTPQAFDFELIFKAHSVATGNYSDDAGLVAKMQPVTLIEGDPSNFKITTLEDLERAQAILKALPR